MGLWIDQGSLDAAAQWGQQIVEALDAAKVMLLMISPAAVRSDNVAKEVTLISERRGHILPLHLEQTIIPPHSNTRWQAFNTSSSTTAIRKKSCRPSFDRWSALASP